MPHEDTQWDEDPSSISSERNRGAVGRNKGCNASAPDSLKPTALTNNQINIELFNTRSLVKEVVASHIMKVLSDSRPNGNLTRG